MGRARGHMQSIGYLNLGFGVVEVLVVTGSEAQLWKMLLEHMARFSGDKGLKNHRKQPHRMHQ